MKVLGIMAEDFISRTRPRTWDSDEDKDLGARTKTRTQLFVLEESRGWGQVLKDTSLVLMWLKEHPGNNRLWWMNLVAKKW